MVLIPLCGAGTRGDQEDNAAFFEKADAALVLGRDKANSENLKNALTCLLDENNRNKYSEANGNLVSTKRPAEKIAELLYEECV